MAQIFKTTIGTTGWGYKVYLVGELTEKSYDITENTSSVERKVWAYIEKGNAADYNTSVSVNGSSVFSGYADVTTSGVVFLNDTITVSHNSDGTGSCSMSASMSMSYLGYSGSGSGSITLTTIPRATAIGNVTATIGTATTIKWTKASSSFTHKLEYTFGSVSGTIGTNLVDSVSWTPPTSLYNQIPNSSSGTGTLKLTTYNGSTQIGDTQTSTLTLNANDNTKPVINSSSVVDTNSTTIALTGNSANLVKGQSNAKVTFVFDTKEYAKAKKITINGTNITIPTGTLQSDNKTTRYTVNFTFNKVTTSSFAIVVKDTRDKEVSTTKTATMVNYITLDAKYNFKRQQPTNGKVVLDFEGNYFNSSFGSVLNTLKISYKYKINTESDYSAESTFVLNTDYKISGNKYYSGTGSSKSQIVLPPTFDYKNVYNVVITAEDKLIKLVTNVTIVKGIPIMWWNGEKVTVNGDLYIADSDGNNAMNVGNMVNISKDEPTDGKLWIKMSKNIFDLSAYPFTLKVAYNGSGDQVWWGDYCGILDYFPVEPNTTYSYSNDLNKGIGYGLVFYDRNKTKISNKNGAVTFTTPDDCYFIRFAMNSATLPTWVQIEKGPNVTSYEPFILKGIYARNNAGSYYKIYEESNYEVYSTQEIRVGTWIDGKPLYQKTILYTAPKVTTNGTFVTKEVTIGSNIDYCFIKESHVIDNSGQVFPLELVTNSGYQVKNHILTNKQIFCTVNSTSFSETQIICTVRYTKTTD